MSGKDGITDLGKPEVQTSENLMPHPKAHPVILGIVMDSLTHESLTGVAR